MSRNIFACLLSFCFAVISVTTAVGADQDNSVESGADIKKVLQKTVEKEDVQEELEADGVSIDLSDENNWKVLSRGTGTFQFNDTDERKEAVEEAMLNAKASMAKFIEEKMSIDDYLDTLVEKKSSKAKGSNGSSGSASSDRMKKSLVSIHNSASEILAGVLTLETTVKWYADQDTGVATVLVGQSEKSLAAVKKFRDRTVAPVKSQVKADASKPGNGSAKIEKKGSSLPDVEKKVNKTDF